MTQKNALTQFPAPAALLEWQKQHGTGETVLVNGHFHTPYSFSAFNEIEQAMQMAQSEGVKVMGINDFYTTDGYAAFHELAVQYKIFPLFNIEFMALQKDLQAAGIRVNDPNNPGRTYFSGKGLRFPVSLDPKSQSQLEQLQTESNLQTAQMVEKLNELLAEIGSDIRFNFDELKATYAKNLLRERHIAKALRIAVYEKYASDEDRKDFFTKVFSGKEAKSSISDIAGLENEIRGNLLKAGGRAFVEETDKAFLSLEDVRSLIINAGGIPCYPVLLDNPKGEFTDFEGNKEQLYKTLTEKGVYSLELIPGRNSFNILKDFVKYFDSKNFVITFGTEHNTPQLDPVTVSCSNNVPLDDELKQIGYKGACVVAAHQYLVANRQEGFLNPEGIAKTEEIGSFAQLGQAVIEYFVNR